MHNRVTWKKGMRLSPEIFNAMDSANEEALRMVALLGSADRFGLFPAKKPFELSVNINSNVLEVTSLCCYGVTKGGCLVDIDYDSNFNNTFDSRIAIPNATEGEAFYLVVKVEENCWREINEVYSEMVYSFALLGENSIIPPNCLPIGQLINQYGWRLNEVDFVPPCLYIGAHPKFTEQLQRAKSLARDLASKCLASPNCIAKPLLTSVWTAAATAFSRLDKEQDTLTPGALFSVVQQLVTSFIIGCFADDFVSLENPDPFALYSLKPLDMKTIYNDVESGLSLMSEITTKITAVCTMTETPKAVVERPAPKPKAPQPTPQVPPQPGRKGWEGIEI